MRRALLNGNMVDVPRFNALAGPNWRLKRVYAHCPTCGAVVHPYRMHIDQGVQRFDHSDLPAGEPSASDCSLARRGGRYAALEVDDADPRRGIGMRNAFRNTAQFTKAFAFVSQVTGGACSLDQFVELVGRADARGIWSFVGLRPWAVPFILATLDDFVSPSGSFRYVMSRARRARKEVAWSGMETGLLRKYFADSGNPYSIGRYIELQVTNQTFHDVISASLLLRGGPPRLIADLRAAAAAL